MAKSSVGTVLLAFAPSRFLRSLLHSSCALLRFYQYHSPPPSLGFLLCIGILDILLVGFEFCIHIIFGVRSFKLMPFFLPDKENQEGRHCWKIWYYLKNSIYALYFYYLVAYIIIFFENAFFLLSLLYLVQSEVIYFLLCFRY